MSQKYEEQFQDSLKDVLNAIFNSTEAEDVTEEVVSGLEDEDGDRESISADRLEEITMTRSAKNLQINLYLCAENLSDQIKDNIGKNTINTDISSLNMIVDIIDKIESR